VEAALYAGLNFFAGYPITPSTEIASFYPSGSRKSEAVSFRWKMKLPPSAPLSRIPYWKQGHDRNQRPGFSLMQEALGYAVMAEIPTVIVNVQRGGPSTGLPPMSARAM